MAAIKSLKSKNRVLQIKTHGAVSPVEMVSDMGHG